MSVHHSCTIRVTNKRFLKTKRSRLQNKWYSFSHTQHSYNNYYLQNNKIIQL